ncbi:MAG: nucleotide pyrophosphohydrolase [Armatimonadetes bacterium]|nr:nucleotide pyrophosphohydrolase [Armatimonadota bacterium]
MADWTVKELQAEVDAWIRESGGGYWKAPSQLLRIMEEVGELARLVNHLHGEKPKKATEARQELPEEIGDLIFTILCLANAEGVDVQAAMESVLAKYRRRDTERWKE